MSPGIPYSAAREDLYYPCKRAVFFPNGLPQSDAALCAEMSRLAYCSLASSLAFDQDKIRKTLAGIGFNDCRFFESKSMPKDGGTHCFIASNAQKLAVVAFRGTDKDDPTDLGDDADIRLKPWEKGGQVHSGFLRALTEVRPALEAALPSSGRVLFTGHSLGAALATLLASARKPDLLCTFGSPLAGDADFISTLGGAENQRYVDCCDIVTRIPPEEFGYRHFGKPHYIDRTRQVTFDPSSEFVSSDQLRARVEFLVKYAWRIGNVAVRDLADHAPVNYVSALT
jgi:hypothetical protein